MASIAFDNEKYLQMQSAHIRDRIAKFGGKLYLEFGGKLYDDNHASRVLPGFQPDSKLRMLLQLKEQVEMVIAINADDIEKNKVRGDLGITYDRDVIRLVDIFRGFGLYVSSVVLTRYHGQNLAKAFQSRLEGLGIRVYHHFDIEGYPNNTAHIVSPEGFGKNDYIETTRSLVVVTAPGPGSGKLATCLSQLYHEHERGNTAGYAKFETFPIWNLSINHPVNLAYEAATADLNDVNMIDPFHLDAYGVTTVNYNRDVEAYPVLVAIFEKILGECPYKSPTDMGVNMVGNCIVDDDAARHASRQEIIRRYFRYRCEYLLGGAERNAADRVKLLMDELNVTETDRPVVSPARQAAADAARDPRKGCDNFYCGAAIRLPDGRVVTGKNSPVLHAAAACVINAVKVLAGLPDELLLISPEVLQSVGTLKRDFMKSKRISLDLGEALIALSVSVPGNSTAEIAMRKLADLNGCEMHLTLLPSPGDEAGLRRLGINLTCDPLFASSNLFED